MVNLFREPYPIAWLKWHAYRQKRNQRGDHSMWRFRQRVRRSRPGQIFLDCGANVGDASALLLKQGVTVHAFEPDPMAAERLSARFGSNPNFTLHRVAVGAWPRRASLYRMQDAEIGDTEASSLIDRGNEFHGTSVDVEVIDLFSFVDALGRKIETLKLDIEGAEIELLERMLDEKRWRQFDLVLVETHERFSDDLDDRLRVIRERIASNKIDNIDLTWV